MGITTSKIEILLAHYFRYSQNIVIPNVSWGADLHECDILTLSKAGYATEVEIKISKSDLVKDKEKKHNHESNKIKYLYFAIPEKLDKEDIIKHIPDRAGIFVVKHRKRDYSIINFNSLLQKYYVHEKRKPKANKNSIRWADSEITNLYRLAYYRLWPLRKKIEKLKQTDG